MLKAAFLWLMQPPVGAGLLAMQATRFNI